MVISLVAIKMHKTIFYDCSETVFLTTTTLLIIKPINRIRYNEYTEGVVLLQANIGKSSKS